MLTRAPELTVLSGPCRMEAESMADVEKQREEAERLGGDV